MFKVIYHKFRCNGWNEWTDKTDIGIVETKEQGFEYAKKHYPNLTCLEFGKKHDYEAFDSKGKKIDIPYKDFIEIKEIKMLGEKQ